MIETEAPPVDILFAFEPHNVDTGHESIFDKDEPSLPTTFKAAPGYEPARGSPGLRLPSIIVQCVILTYLPLTSWKSNLHVLSVCGRECFTHNVEYDMRSVHRRSGRDDFAILQLITGTRSYDGFFSVLIE